MQTSGDNLGQVALLVALGYLDGFVDLAFTQGASDGGSKGARLLTGCAERHRSDQSSRRWTSQT